MTLDAGAHADWWVPQWPAAAGVRALCTTRQGGASPAPWDSMNLGDHVGDASDRVVANRRRLAHALNARTAFLKQTHSTVVVAVERDTTDGMEADGCFTVERGVACTVMVADCLPVLFATRSGAVVAAAHAGWRGLAGVSPDRSSGQLVGILEATVSSMRASARDGHAAESDEIMAWLGPCIGPQAFEVGAEVKAACEVHSAAMASCFQTSGTGKFNADLAGLARLRLQAMGVRAVYGNDSRLAWCTASNQSLFFSHRRDAGVSGNGYFTTGRMAACIWRD